MFRDESVILKKISTDGSYISDYRYYFDFAENNTPSFSNLEILLTQAFKNEKLDIPLSKKHSVYKKSKSNLIMTVNNICILGAYAAINTGELSLNKIVSDFQKKNEFYQYAINYFNSFFGSEKSSFKKKVGTNYEGVMAKSLFHNGIMIVSDLVKKIHDLEQGGLFQEAVLLEKKLQELGIATLNAYQVFRSAEHPYHNKLVNALMEHETKVLIVPKEMDWGILRRNTKLIPVDFIQSSPNLHNPSIQNLISHGVEITNGSENANINTNENSLGNQAVQATEGHVEQAQEIKQKAETIAVSRQVSVENNNVSMNNNHNEFTQTNKVNEIQKPQSGSSDNNSMNWVGSGSVVNVDDILNSHVGTKPQSVSEKNEIDTHGKTPDKTKSSSIVLDISDESLDIPIDLSSMV